MRVKQVFLNLKESVFIQKFDLNMWPGYDCSIKCLNDGLFFNVELTSKFAQRESILDKIKGLKREKMTD